GFSPASVLIVGHQADEVDSIPESFQVVASPPLLKHPCAEGSLARMSGRVGNNVDLNLQVLLVEGVSDFLYERGEAIAIGPHDIFDVEICAVVAVLFALAKEGSDQRVLSFC